MSHDQRPNTRASLTLAEGAFSRRDLTFGLAFAVAAAPLAVAAQTAKEPPSAKPTGPQPPKPAGPGATTPPAASQPKSAPGPSAADLASHLQPDQRAMLARALADVESHGFGRGEFAASGKSGDEALVVAVLAYARAQHGGRMTDWPKDWALRPASYEAERELAFALRQNNVQAWLDSLPPPFERYRALRTALVDLRKAPKPKAAADPGAGSPDDGGAAPAAGAPGPAAPAKRASASKGPTLSPTQQADTLRANMERWRWMPRNIPADRIEVNIAADTLVGYRGAQPAINMLVASGKPKDETPILTSVISSVVVNPVWHVPDSIAKKELFPKNRRNHSYLRTHGFKLVQREGQTRIEQKSGARNALGQLKFDFPNPFAVYLHDTPSHAAFNRNSRDVSHGCVRLEKPLDLGGFVFQGDAQWNPDSLKAAEDQGDTKRIQLGTPMPVFLLYWTAFEGGDHGVTFVKDVYGWDTKLVQLLAAGERHA